MHRQVALIALVLGVAAGATAGTPAAPAFRDRLPQDEFVYFLLPDRFENGDPANDRGGLGGDRMITGFDPANSGFYHGGDLRGLIARLDYIQALGATAIWLGPIYKNKPVQGIGKDISAGYHGYWITDFTAVDPHFGTEADMHALVEAVHARGMKIYLDIITNHTADVIAYRECPASACPYRSRADYPYTRRGGLTGEPINAGFGGDGPGQQNAANFARLTRPDFAYTPFVPPREENVKVPAWLNDPVLYHNRGNTTWTGESSEMGDFGGLDDLMTENPRVVQGFVGIYGDWIDRYGVDGFRIDTAKHVNAEFWQAFAPAMQARAAARGIPNFHIFGEVYGADVALLARATRVARLPTILDFAFAEAVRATLAGSAGTDRFAELFASDPLYEGGAATALQLPTFISNHDMGRFAYMVRAERPKASLAEVLQRVTLAHAMLLTLRGVPVVYSGDEQGFIGRGNDRAARQPLFPNRVAEYNADKLLGTKSTTASSNFDTQHPLFRTIAELARLRSQHAALRSGRQVVRNYSDKPGLLAVSRFDPATGREIVIAFNTSTAPLTAQVEIDATSRGFTGLHGVCAAEPSAPGSLRVSLAPLDYVVCAAGGPQ